METQSTSCSSLILIEGLESYLKYLREICAQPSQDLSILTKKLDPLLFNDTETIDRIRELISKQPKFSIRILVMEPSDLTSQRNNMLLLSQRLPSRIKIKQLSSKPRNEKQNFIIADKDRVLLQHEAENYSGFYNSDARAEAKTLLEEFHYLWERQSMPIPDLTSLGV
jgi:hypothetical protein